MSPIDDSRLPSDDDVGFPVRKSRPPASAPPAAVDVTSDHRSLNWMPAVCLCLSIIATGASGIALLRKPSIPTTMDDRVTVLEQKLISLSSDSASLKAQCKIISKDLEEIKSIKPSSQRLLQEYNSLKRNIDTLQDQADDIKREIKSLTTESPKSKGFP